MNKYRNLPKEVYIICMGVLFTNLGNYVFPLLTFIGGDLGLSLKDISIVTSLMIVFSIAGLTIGGKLIDIVGRKKIFTTFMFLSGLVYLIIPLFEKTGFIICIFMATLFMAMSRPATSVMITDITSQEQRKSALSLNYVAMNIGFSFGPAIGAYIYNIDINYLFIGDGITTMIFALLISLLVKETKPENMEEHNVKGEEHHEGSILDVLKAKPELVYLVMVSSLVMFSYTQVGYSLPIHLGHIFGKAEGIIIFGLCMTINGLLVAAGTPVVTILTSSLKDSTHIVISGILYVIGFAIIAFAKTPAVLYISTVIWSLGEILNFIGVMTYTSKHTPISHRGRLSAFTGNTISLVKMASMLIVGQIIVGVDVSSLWIVLSIFPLVASIVGVRLYRYEDA